MPLLPINFPTVQLATCWDGLVSFLRVYSPQELKKMVDTLCVNEYQWEFGQAFTGHHCLYSLTWLDTRWVILKYYALKKLLGKGRLTNNYFDV
jgi:hypothetical protein